MILIDAHVHIYMSYDLQLFFHSAFRNFHNAAKFFSVSDRLSLVLLLTESGNLNRFSELSGYAAFENHHNILPENLRSFKIIPSDDKAVLRIINPSNDYFFIAAGRQIVTKEKLEVLALLTADRYEDGKSAEYTVKSVSEKGGIPVFPWGFGKWFGKRGKIVRQILEKAETSAVLSGDIQGRPLFFPVPPLFKSAKKRGIRILSGTDPFPLPLEEKNAGSFGSVIFEKLNEDKPFSHLKELLKNNRTEIATYGKRTRLIQFFRNQMLIRLKKGV